MTNKKNMMMVISLFVVTVLLLATVNAQQSITIINTKPITTNAQPTTTINNCQSKCLQFSHPHCEICYNRCEHKSITNNNQTAIKITMKSCLLKQCYKQSDTTCSNQLTTYLDQQQCLNHCCNIINTNNNIQQQLNTLQQQNSQKSGSTKTLFTEEIITQCSISSTQISQSLQFQRLLPLLILIVTPFCVCCVMGCIYCAQNDPSQSLSTTSSHNYNSNPKTNLLQKTKTLKEPLESSQQLAYLNQSTHLRKPLSHKKKYHIENKACNKKAVDKFNWQKVVNQIFIEQIKNDKYKQVQQNKRLCEICQQPDINCVTDCDHTFHLLCLGQTSNYSDKCPHCNDQDIYPTYIMCERCKKCQARFSLISDLKTEKLQKLFNYLKINCVECVKQVENEKNQDPNKSIKQQEEKSQIKK